MGSIFLLMYTLKTTHHIRTYSDPPELPRGRLNKHDALFQDMKDQEHTIENYARKIAQALETTPDSEGALSNTLAEMSDSII